MRRQLLFALILLGLFSACKKSDETVTNLDLLTRNKWFLVSAIISPIAEGSPLPSTDLMKTDQSTCLANNFTYKFSRNGTYLASSTGALCDMVGGPQAYSFSDGSLKIGMEIYTIKKLSKSDLVYTIPIGDNHVLTYKFVNSGF